MQFKKLSSKLFLNAQKNRAIYSLLLVFLKKQGEHFPLGKDPMLAHAFTCEDAILNA
jgi:hypothetical protein